jgi:hypothetical protein
VEQNVFLQDALREFKVLPVTRGCHLAHSIVVTPMHRTFTASNCLQYLSRSIKDAVRQKVEKDPRRLSS